MRHKSGAFVILKKNFLVLTIVLHYDRFITVSHFATDFIFEKIWSGSSVG